MRRILLASAALLTIALFAPMAGAQYADPIVTPPAQTQSTDPMTPDAISPSASEAAPMPADPSAPDPYAPPPAPTTPDPNASTTAQTTATPDPYAQTPDADAMAAQTPEEQSAPDAYATPAAAAASIDLMDEATMAGMDSVPMTAAEVCAPRSVSLTESSSRLNVAARRHLINASDMASVCELQSVVIHSPTGRADAARATLAELGVDESKIDVQQGDGGMTMDMTFNGVHASSEQYAQMFNGVQTASYAPPDSTAPSAPGEETGATQPSGYAPAGTDGAETSSTPMNEPAPTNETMNEPAPAPMQEPTSPGY